MPRRRLQWVHDGDGLVVDAPSLMRYGRLGGPSLAARHANRWCSSLRRARHFDVAWANLNSYSPTSHRAAIAQTQAAGDAAAALGASLWGDE